MPAVSDAMATGKIHLVRSRIEDAFRITLIMGLLMAAIFLVLPHELSSTLFGYRAAGGALFILALSSPFLYLQQTVNGVLQGLGRPDIPFKNLLKSSIVKILGIYFLTSIPGFGILGTALAMGSTYVLMCLLNYLELKKLTGFRIDPIPHLLKPLGAAGAAAAVMIYLKLTTASIVGLPGLLIKLAGGSLTYLLLLYIIGSINASDIRRVRLIFRR
jgi:stage V sporulation protein B